MEINQVVGCARQFFTKSFLGDDAAVLAQSSGEEPAAPRHRAGVASMASRSASEDSARPGIYKYDFHTARGRGRGFRRRLPAVDGLG